LTARQELSCQGVGLASQDNSDTHCSNAGHDCTLTPHDCASARPARPVLQQRTLGIQQQLHQRRTARLVKVQATQQQPQWRTGDVARRRRWKTGAGGVTSYTAAAPVEHWRHCAAVLVEDRRRRTFRDSGASSRSHGPAAERPELGL
jgi:hypothetical protein